MKNIPRGLLIFIGVSAATLARGEEWTCSFNGHSLRVDFDPQTRLLQFTDGTGVTTQGYANSSFIADAPNTEYFLPYDLNDYSYYFRLWRDNRRATFSYCWDCAPYVCSPD